MKLPWKISGSEFKVLLHTALIAVIAYLLLFGLLSAAITPQRYDIRVGMPADATIYANEDVVDTVTTQQLRDAAAAQVDVSYKSVDESVTTQVTEDLSALFEQLLALYDTREDAETLTIELSPDQLEALFSASRETLEALFNRALEYTHDTLVSSLPEGQEEAMLSRLERDLRAEGYDADLVGVAVAAVRDRIRPNMLIDVETTELNRQRARDEVEDVVCVTGEVIVRQGAIVTPAQYAMLDALGKVDNDPTNMILGSALLMLGLVAAAGLYMYRYERDIARHPRTLLLLAILYVLVVGLALFFRIFNPYFVPTATGLGLLLITLLVRPRLAVFSTMLLAVPVSLIAGSNDNGLFNAITFSVLLMAFLSGPVAVTVLRHRQQRTAALLAGVLVGVSNFISVIAVGMINGAVSSDTALNGLCAAGSGLCAAILCIGVQPILEWLFNLTTSAKLLELSNPNQPLLRRMLLEAPGSYHHSIIVANLAETAASAIGANGLLARVGAYYHDVGKLKRPQYFKENQMTGDNPHDRTDPRVSAAILTAHTRDGYQMGLKARLPEPILDIIRQHHGDSPMVFFYDKAVKLYGDKVDISAFRYEGPRPRSREAAVVMLADTIEAAARALPNPDPEKVDALIRKLVRAKMTDGQLDESELTFADLDRICRAFQSVLSGVFHERIEYPDIAIPPRTESESAPPEEGAIAPEAETEDTENAP
ncbi:MAG TPA: HDIG domain-containing protein [Candidatus Pullichristensenella stercorigallinarum]|uniref:HDIG domain-containing protein n=1 Tax=Candidatus Pullichristensenella stercorigallinarum TaxID=2840909 RepID=A0A9D0ZK38_9FIRM|nr:HDIG domain-containing protein [Candidatus Pullichristensenella stercorigallinarum]